MMNHAAGGSVFLERRIAALHRGSCNFSLFCFNLGASTKASWKTLTNLTLEISVEKGCRSETK